MLFLTLWWIELRFWFGYHCILLWAWWPFFYINPANLRAWKVFPTSVIFFNFFLQRLKFLSHSSFSCLVRITPRYFILFVAIMKSDISLTSFSAYLLKATDLPELILYPASLLTLLIRCRSSLVNFLGHLSILSYHLQIVIIWILSFQFLSFWPPFFLSNWSI